MTESWMPAQVVVMIGEMGMEEKFGRRTCIFAVVTRFVFEVNLTQYIQPFIQI